ncbi:MAG TPA: zinc-dependent metalloprotease [Puia sp.]|nr:zinc-dependent metalloprotease [Puia sp.]
MFQKKTKLLLLFLFTTVFLTVIKAQDKKIPVPAASKEQNPGANVTSPKTGPKPYKEVITDKAKTFKGLFTVHKVEDKWYFEIPDSLFGREILAITRIAKTATGAGFGGEEVNEQVLKFEKGPDNKIFLRVAFYVNVASDTLPIYQAVKSSNVEPIAAAFDVKAFGKDSTSSVIDVTDFFKGDNQVVSIPSGFKRAYNITAPASDRSYINYIKTFPINTEIRVTRTYSASPPPPGISPFPTANLIAASETGAVTLELHTSMIELPKTPYRRRFYDERVSYFSDGYTNYGLDAQKSESERFIVRWKLEPKPEDVEKMKRGELVEPQKPIVYYIDPATPVKWRKYLKLGIEDWQKAFEKAGFKNAIIAKDWPENDSTMSLEDARFSVIRYFASDIENAYGPNVHDPRSGEIIESHIGWYHNVMNLLRDWYLIQTAAVDPRARKMKFDDELMGQLVRFVSSHEVGHTLGLPHNMGSSSATPVEKLRDKAWVEANGHTASIMDYARFNYVAQPEDSIGPAGLYPRIGDYDKWAIEWGYKIIPDKDEKSERAILNDWAKEHASNPRFRFLRQRFIPTDPRAQTEDLGDNSMKASEYGIKNLKRILPNLSKWTFAPGEPFDNLDELYEQVIIQLRRYMGHVTTNIGGIYEDPKTYDQQGEVFTPVPKNLQKDAVAFLNKNAFETPQWLLDWKQLKEFNQDQVVEEIRSFQQGVLAGLSGVLDPGRLERMSESTAQLGKDAYTTDELMDDLRKGIWSEIYARKSIDIFRRDLQKVFVETLGNIINGTASGIRIVGLSGRTASAFGITNVNVRTSDIISVAKGTLRTLKTDINAALPAITDKMTKYHLQDMVERINLILNPKG